MLGLFQEVHRELQMVPALDKPPELDQKDFLRLESSDSYTHQSTAPTGKRVYISTGTHNESKRQKTSR